MLPSLTASEPAVTPSSGVCAVSPEISVEPRGRDIELVGGDLAHGGEDALAQLDAAGHDRDAAVGRDAHPGVELGIGLGSWAARAARLAVPWAAAQRKPMVRPATAEAAPMPKARRLRVDVGADRHGVTLPAGGALDGANDALLAAAAAQVGVHVLADLRLGRVGRLGQQGRRLHDHAVGAIAALQRLLGDESRLQRDAARPGVPRPSSVTILASCATSALTGVWQERTARPSTCTVQAPHMPLPHPSLGPLSARSLRST